MSDQPQTPQQPERPTGHELASATGSALKQRVHVIPLGHPEPLHTAQLTCWCSPLQKADDVIIHHTKDGHEKWERQGIIDQDKPWCLVYEDVPNKEVSHEPSH